MDDASEHSMRNMSEIKNFLGLLPRRKSNGPGKKDVNISITYSLMPITTKKLNVIANPL